MMLKVAAAFSQWLESGNVYSEFMIASWFPEEAGRFHREDNNEPAAAADEDEEGFNDKLSKLNRRLVCSEVIEAKSRL